MVYLYLSEINLINLETYQNNITDYQQKLSKIKRSFNSIAMLRLTIVLLVITGIYLWLYYKNTTYLIPSGLLVVSYFFVLKYHDKVRIQRALFSNLLDINKGEIDYLTNYTPPFYNGLSFINPHHNFSFDLDFFGEKGLYHHLNRTKTYIGNTTLANDLTSEFSIDQIKNRQTIIQELSENVKFRQDFLANAMLIEDSKEDYNQLQFWLKKDHQKTSKLTRFIAIVSPTILVSLFIVNLFTSYNFTGIISLLFILNLFVLVFNISALKTQIVEGDHTNKIIKKYSALIQLIETQSFKSDELKSIQQKLTSESKKASDSLKQLSSLFNSIDNLQNLIGAVLFNGFSLNHIHVYNKLINWKNVHGNQLNNWINIIGEFEALNSLANFKYNNPSFCFPEINQDKIIDFKNMGHPLLNSGKRINNDIDFNTSKFVILTGSNMSGKSTFLRTLGVNMVLASIGAPVCASSAKVHPMNVLVSMRLTDSLSDSESYFYAEIKRLKHIIDQLTTRTSLVLLDEILKGTNSDDKQFGTIEVIKQLMHKNAIGIIATHDLEVCETINQFPEKLVNKCFEVEVINNDLHFDYKIRNGICKNKSATFLMKKLNVIPQEIN